MSFKLHPRHLTIPPEKNVQRLRLVQFLQLLLGFLLPITACGVYFAHNHALSQLWYCVITINSRWASEWKWSTTWHEDAPFGLAVYAVAFIEVVSIAQTLVVDLRAATMRSLAMYLFLTGIVAFLTTPVPFAQSFIMFVLPWAIYLCIQRVTYWLNYGVSKCSGMGVIVGIIALCLTLSATTVIKTTLIWSVLFIVAWILSSRRRNSMILAGWLLIVPLASCIRSTIVDWRPSLKSKGDSIVDRAIDVYAPPPAPIVSMWSVVRPFQEIPIYHWFAHSGIIGTVNSDELSAEYIGALQSGKANVAVVNSKDVQEHFPSLLRFLQGNATCVAHEDQRYGNEVYVLIKRN